jgi:hypothetical protein
MGMKSAVAMVTRTAMVVIAISLSLSACFQSFDTDPRTVESTPALFLDDSDLPEGWIVTSPPSKSYTSAYDFAESYMGPAVGSRHPPGAALEIKKSRSPGGAEIYYNGQLNLPTQYEKAPEGFTAYPQKADAYRLGCDPFRIYLHCLYRARYGVYTVDFAVSLNPSTAAADLTKMINAIERRLGHTP